MVGSFRRHRPLRGVSRPGPDTSSAISAAPTPSLRDELDRVHHHPARSHDLANATLAQTDLDDHERALALWLLGRAKNEVGEVGAACAALAEARQLAVDVGRVRLAAEIAVSEAACLAANGDPEGARARLAEAEPVLDGSALARLVMQRGLLALHRGDLADALADFDAAEPGLRAASDAPALARLLANRGAVLAQLHRLTDARADLDECRDLAATAELGMISAGATHNLAYVHGRLGEFAESIREYERARHEYESAGMPRRAFAVLEYDLCTTMSAAGLRAEAIEAGRRAAAASHEAGDVITEGDALLQLAIAEVADHRAAAVSTARRALDVLREAKREPLAALAEYVMIRARLEHEQEPVDAQVLRRSIATLTAAGWAEEADDARLFLVAHLDATGTSADTAEVDLLLSDVAQSRRAGAWHRRVIGWYAEALRRMPTDSRGAERALAVGLRIAAEHRATFGDTDLRAFIATRTDDLVQAGLRSALDAGDGRRIAAWIDRAHAPSLAHRSTRDADEALATLLDRWRSAQRSGPDDPAGITDLERQIRIASRSSTAERRNAARPDRGFSSDVIIIDMTVVDDDVVTARWRGDDVSVSRHQGYGVMREAMTYADAAIRRLARSHEPDAATEAAEASLADVAATLDAALLQPLAVPHDVPLVLVADPALSRVPWSALESMRGRTWAVTPSASSWRTGASFDRPRMPTGPAEIRRVAAVAGPDLDFSDDEVEAVGSIWRHQGLDVRVSESTASSALVGLGTSDLMHIAAHGRFRSDSPTFSAFLLADGPLTVYDLQTLTDTPHTVVLAGCDLARMSVDGATDLLGAASALLQLGVEAVIAPLTIVDDHAAMDLMLALHRALAAGEDPAAALATARRATASRGPAALAAAMAFVVISADPAVPSGTPLPGAGAQ